ncbi:MAG: GNAT family N-acetyltransferase [Caldilinea sp. CFX5]|nr:GNAT family N-acetyltransferase [Caldilinea sp. CFX5]
MIRPLTETDRAVTVRFLSSAPQLNLYMLGNLEKLGFTNAICEFWGDVVEQAGVTTMRAVLNRYMTGWTIYGVGEADWGTLGAILDQHPAGANRLQDNPGGIDSFLPYLQRYRAENIKIEEVMALHPADFQPVTAPKGVVIRRGTLADLPRLIEFYANAEHLSRSPAGVERPLRDTRLWLAEQTGNMVATALTNAETNHWAMIGGVYTPPAMRGRGLSQAVCSALCTELIAEQKQPILYWDTPAAGAVYRKLGFRATGTWRSVWLHSV